MLIRFGCSNYRSISEYQELLLTASSLKDDQSDLILSDSFREPLLPGLAIYGANASGKTNLLMAFQEMLSFIHTSHKRANVKGIKRNTFRLDEGYERKPSEFDFDFLCNGEHFHYGFKYDNECILEEWLYSFSYINKKSRKILFHRNSEEIEPFYFGKSLPGKNKVIQDLVRPNSLFLSAAAQNNHKSLTNIYEYVKKNFKFRFDQDLNDMAIGLSMELSENTAQVVEFLKELDTGIKNIEVSRQKFEEKQHEMLIAVNGVIRDKLGERNKNDDHFLNSIPSEFPALILSHESVDGELVKFKLEEESLGTRSVIALLIPIFAVLSQGGVLIVDELESSLHALLTLQILTLFSKKETNPKGAQLIFSTHETNILCSNLLRRDQIWFAEKCQAGNTVATPLTDFRLRKDFDIQSGYMEGRFGAIPFYGNLNQLFRHDEAINV